MVTRDLLERYRAKRDFKRTPEPAAGGAAAEQGLTFVVQKHAARHLHYDFRLELQGTLKSWAVPKGPSLDPTVKRMGVQVEDHPLAYAAFEGSIPPRQYGAGDVIVWDRGRWTPVGDPLLGLERGKLKFELHGEKLKGGWTLVRLHGRGGKNQENQESQENQKTQESHEPWLLIKEQDEHARPAQEFDVLQVLPDSVLSGQPLPQKPQPAPAKSSKPSKPGSAARASSGMPAGAVQAQLPASLAPQLATLVDQVPTDPQGWV